MEWFWIERDWQVDVESSEMREELGLRYYLDQGAEQMTSEELAARPRNTVGEWLNPGFPILGVFRLNEQPKRDGSIIVRSCKASQSPVYPIRDAILAVNHASCPSLSSSGPPPVG